MKLLSMQKFFSTIKEFMFEIRDKPIYQIIDIYECEKTKFTKAQVKISGRHIIEKNISDIVLDISMLEGFDKKSIRTLTYLATLEKLKPDFSIIMQKLGTEVDDFILEIRSKNGKEVKRKSATEVSRDKSLLLKFSPLDANRIGYLAGIKEAAKEFNIKPKISDCEHE